MPEASLSCYTRRDDRTLVFVMEGCLDLATSEQAANALQGFVAEHGPYIVVDTSRLDFIDSKGIGALLGAARAAREAGGQLFLQNPALPVRKILDMCGLTPLFPPRPEPPAGESGNGTGSGAGKPDKEAEAKGAGAKAAGGKAAGAKAASKAGENGAGAVSAARPARRPA